MELRQMAALAVERGRVCYLHDNTSDDNLHKGKVSKPSSTSMKNNMLSLPLAVYGWVFICILNRKLCSLTPAALTCFLVLFMRTLQSKTISAGHKSTCLELLLQYILMPNLLPTCIFTWRNNSD